MDHSELWARFAASHRGNSAKHSAGYADALLDEYCKRFDPAFVGTQWVKPASKEPLTGPLAVGQVWLTRKGEVCTISGTTSDPEFPFILQGGNTVTRYGRFRVDFCAGESIEDENDLIERIE